MTITVHGASDDLIEVEGDIREEFSGGPSNTDLLAFSDGTVLQITYGKSGVWRINLAAAGTATVNIVQAPLNDDDNYSDRATLDGDIRWVVRGQEMAVKR